MPATKTRNPPPAATRKISVYVSYNARDEAATEQVVQKLRKAGVTAWMSSLDLKGGDDWRAVIRTAKKHNNIWLIFAGPHGIGPSQAVEVEEAIAQLESRPGKFRVVPVLLPGTGPNERAKLPELFRNLYYVEFHTLADQLALSRLLKAIRGEIVETTATPSADVQTLAASRRRLATLAARLVLRTPEAMNLVKAPDAAAFHDALRAAGVTSAKGVLDLETTLAHGAAPFEPNQLWLAWIETVHGSKLDLIGKELLTLPAETPTGADTNPGNLSPPRTHKNATRPAPATATKAATRTRQAQPIRRPGG